MQGGLVVCPDQNPTSRATGGPTSERTAFCHLMLSGSLAASWEIFG